MSASVDVAPWRRQSSRTSESETESQNQCQAAPVNNSNVPPAPCSPPSAPPAPPAPPPPPPPTLNGGVLPSIRLKSEISDRNEPPAKLQNAMMKDKKPFTYTPGGIDLSEIKSPRMQRRIVRNAQTPEDIILPPTSTTPVNANLLPPSALAAMTPQIAIPVFPQNNKPLKKYNSPNQPPPPPSHHEQNTSQKQNIPPPPPPPKSSNAPPAQTQYVSSTPAQKQNVPPPPPPHKNLNSQPSSATQQNPAVQRVEKQPTVSTNNNTNINAGSNENKRNTSSTPQQSTGGQDNNSRSRVGTLYIPPVSNAESNASKQNSSPPTFPVLREAPTPWLQKHQQQSESVPAWVNKNNNESENETKEKIYERKARVPPVQVHKDAHNENISNGGTRVIPIRIEGSSQVVNQQNQRSTSQRWGNNTAGDYNQPVQSHENSRNASNVTNKAYSEPDSKPIQSRSFKVIQKITGSDDDATDFNPNIPYNTERVPLSQLRKLQLNDDDQAFMNRVKAQVDDDTFLHMETDPRYRGSVIPSRAFRMLQNMTDSGQVTNNTSTNNASANHSPVHNGNHAPSHTQGHNNFPAGANRTNSNARTQERPNVTVIETETNIPVNKKTYIPPSERQAEQELRKYMGSSIPSRSFKMLQAMTATQDTSGRPGESDF